jgi:hypothetical protein
MSEVDKKVVYIGSDQEFLKKLEDFYYTRILSSRCQVESILEDELDNLFPLLLDKLPHLILIDFSHDTFLQQDTVVQIERALALLKGNPLFKGIAIVGLFLDLERVWDNLGLM